MATRQPIRKLQDYLGPEGPRRGGRTNRRPRDSAYRVLSAWIRRRRESACEARCDDEVRTCRGLVYHGTRMSVCPGFLPSLLCAPRYPKRRSQRLMTEGAFGSRGDAAEADVSGSVGRSLSGRVGRHHMRRPVAMLSCSMVSSAQDCSSPSLVSLVLKRRVGRRVAEARTMGRGAR